MNNESKFYHLPDELPDRDNLIHYLLQSGAKLVSTSSIVSNYDSHYKGIFDQAPVSIWEEDFSKVKIRLDELRQQGITDLRSFCEQNPDFVDETIALVRIIDVNQTGIEFYGATSHDELTASLSLLIHNVANDLFIGQLQAIWEHQTIFNQDGINFSIHGEKLDVNVRWKVFPGHEESYDRILLIVLDISKQQCISRALKNSEECYQAICEITSDFAYALSYSPSGTFKVEWVTDSFSMITGYTIQDITEAGTMDLFTHPDDRILLKEAGMKILQGQTVDLEMRIITKSGNTLWMHSTNRPIKPFSNSQNLLIIGAVKDITDRKNTEIALNETQIQLHQRIHDLEKRTKEITLLTAMTNNLQLCRSIKEACDVVAEYANLLLPSFSGGIYLHSSENESYVLAISWGTKTTSHKMAILKQDCWALRRGSPFLSQGENRTLVCTHTRPNTETTSSFCMPVNQQGNLIGLFCLEADRDRAEIDSSAQQILSAMSEQFGMTLSNIHLRENLSEQAVHDPLTGLYNRYYMEEFLEKEIHRARRSNKPVSVIMIDMDHFRDLNSLFGHPNVDIALSEVGIFLARSIRAGDVACRYGGDEFLLILPGTCTDIARERAEQLCRAVHSVYVQSETRPPQPISFSVGVACFPDHGQSVKELLHAADAAVYLAKDKGRDRVEIAS